MIEESPVPAATPVSYCSYFDHRYLARALCLYDSLCRHSSTFEWHVLALSGECERLLSELNLPQVKVTTLAEIEASQPELLQAKQNRSLVEYYFTLTAAFCRYAMDAVSNGALLTYLDSDLYFFRSPQPVFDELEESSVGIIEHRFSLPNRVMIANGIFNVGWVSFRKDADGVGCLTDWNKKCLDWCYDRVEAERFADQKYLDQWPKEFENVCVIEHRGANVGPWNVADFQLQPSPPKGCSPIAVDGTPLLFAHFQNVRRVGYRTYETGFDVYKIESSSRREIAKQIYAPYLRHLNRRERHLRKLRRDDQIPDASELRQPQTRAAYTPVRTLLQLPAKYISMNRQYNWITI
jgi:hypothetical protein